MDNENKNIIVGEDGSYFDGGYWAYIFRNLAVSIGTSATFGIAYPWLKCWFHRWICEHTVISGKRKRFEGNGTELFGKYIIWLLLSYVTCGIYTFWMAVSVEKWFAENTYFEGEPDRNSFFDGTVGEYFVTRILANVVATAIPFVGPSWSSIIMKRWWTQHTVIDSRRLTFDGGIGDLFVRNLLWGFLTSITCGIFAWFWPVKYLKWQTEHTLDENETPEAKTAKANYKTQIHTDAVMLKTMDAEKLESIREEMNNDARQGLEIGEGPEALEKLENAIRFADMLKEADVVLNDDEIGAIYDCTVLARKIKAVKPVGTSSKKWMIIVAAVVAGLLALSIIGGVVIGGLMFLGGAADFGAIGKNYGNMGMLEASQNIYYDDFYSDFKYKAENEGFTVQEIASGVDGCVLELKNSDGKAEVSLQADDNNYISYIEISSKRSTDKSDGAIVLLATKYATEALDIYETYEPYMDGGAQAEYFSGWNFSNDTDSSTYKITIVKDMTDSVAF